LASLVAYPKTMPTPLPASIPVNDRGLSPPLDIATGLAAGWELLHEAGEAIAGLAQLGSEPHPIAARDFAMRAAAAGPARLALAEQAIDDCAAALHSGLTALMAGVDAGRDITAAALTLWREFDRARTGLLNLTATPS
jgi:hypothetical protein